MRKVRILTYIFLCILFSVPFLGAQYAQSKYSVSDATHQDTIKPGKAVEPIAIHKDMLRLPQDSAPALRDSLNIFLDSLRLPNDSLLAINDSLPSDTMKNKAGLDAVVEYTANDSIVMLAGNWAYLYGAAEVKYSDLKLNGEKVTMNMDSSLVYADFGLDSLGQEFGYPIFSQGGTDYESKSMKYNFKTKKGYITNVITQQGEGYVIAGRAKKNEDNSFFMREGKYTTCDDHEHPHFYLALTKAKVKPKKNVVTGPAYLVIEGLPLPIGLPFGFFPFSDKYSSGVIMPSYGDELERGFNLRDGGYYFAINDNIDLALTGEIYTKGSWGINARSTYRYRYRRSGSLDFGYLVTKRGEKDVDYSVAKDLRINWTHTQDPKADMFRTLSASVNFSTSSMDRNDLNTAYIPKGTQNTKSSTINLSQKIPNSPWSFSASVSVNQISQDSSISMTLPNLMATMSRVYPFKRKESVGDEKWYEKISLSYTGELRNSIHTKENLLFKSNLQKDWKNAMRHSVPVSATFSLFNYLNITPSINYNERWYTNKIERGWDSETRQHVVTDTTYSFNRVYDFAFSLGFQTKLYGFFSPLFSPRTRIRHVLTPSISFGFTPDFSKSFWGFWKSYNYLDAKGTKQTYYYSPYEQGMFGTAPRGASGSISFSLDNNLEMKIPWESDSTGLKKISLIDNLSLNTSYNMMADEFKWSDINANMRLKFSKSFTVNIGAVFDPYMYEVADDGVNGRKIDRLRIENRKGFGRLKSTGYSISPSINQDTFKKWFGKDDGKDKGKKNSQSVDEDGYPIDETGEEAEESRGSMLGGKKDDGEYDEDGYLKNDIKWNLGFSFGMNLSYGRFDIHAKEYKYRVNKNFSLNGGIQPTRNWSFNFNTSYDFDQNKIVHLNCNLTRNLHCWSITASFVPVGPYKSYFVSLRASSSMLQDLKYEQRGRASSYDPDWD